MIGALFIRELSRAGRGRTIHYARWAYAGWLVVVLYFHHAAYWSDYYAVHHYVFTDATGADYVLDTPTTLYSGGSTVWTSKDGAYVWYNAATNQLFFADGTNWLMGQLSGSAEPDALRD